MSRAAAKADERREIAADQARAARAAEGLLADLEDLEASADAALIDGADEATAERILEERLAELQRRYRELITTPERAAAAAERLLEEDDRYERVRLECQVRADRARRRRDRVRRALWGALVDWATHTPPEPRTKTVRLPGTTARLTYRAHQGRAEVRDAEAALDWVRTHVGYWEALERGLVRVKEEPSRSGLLAWINETGESVPGVDWTPPGDELHLYRR